jgi:putative endonuclease
MAEGSCLLSSCTCKRVPRVRIPASPCFQITMYYVYVLRVKKTGKHYVGQTENLTKRLEKHSRGETKSMKNRGEFEMVYVEKCSTRSDAMRREKEIKSYKGGEAFKRLLSGYSKNQINDGRVG